MNRRICKKALENKKDLNNKLGNAKLGFQSDMKIFLSENLTPYSQHLARMCRELKQVRRIHSCGSSKVVVKIHRTMNNERAIRHIFSKKCFFLKLIIDKFWVLFAYMMKHLTITAQGVSFLCMFIVVIM